LVSVAALAFVVSHRDLLGATPSVVRGPVVATCDEYQAIQDGMTLSQVQDLIGGPAQNTMSMELKTDGFASYSWSGDKRFSSVYVSFDRAGQVETKSQFDVCP
jgi:hypothetical protein